MGVKVSMKVNGKPASAEVEERTLLVSFIRETLRLTGTHVGCDTAQCGACTVSMNGKAVSAEVEERTLLVSLIRDTLRLTGTHVGCDTAQCGACTVLVDGKAVKSCNMLAVQAQGAEITTI